MKKQFSFRSFIVALIMLPFALMAFSVENYHPSQRNNCINPTGSVITYAGSTAPTGYLVCNGQAVSRTTYAALYNVLGTLYGVGNGTTTFNLPDLRDRGIIGCGTTYALAANAGQFAQDFSHTHGIGSIATASSGSHNHTGLTGAVANSLGLISVGVVSYAVGNHTHSISSDGGHTHSLSGLTGSSLSSLSVLDPVTAMNYIIKI